MSREIKNLVPELRFPEFQSDWNEDRVDSFVKRVSNPVEVELDTTYREIGVRSHGRGIFHKPIVTGSDLGNKRVFWVHSNAFVVNIVFGWEQAVALTTQEEDGFIASHRFPMFVPKKNKIDLQFMLLFFLRKRGKHLLELASPGGAGRNKTLGQGEFAKLKIVVPSIEEQRKIAEFLTTVSTKIGTLHRKRTLLTDYKRGVMQKLFTQEIRFVGDGERPFPDWEVKRLGELGNFKNGLNASKEAFGSGMQFINLMDVFGKAEIKKTPLERVEISKKELENYRIQKGDVLFVRSSVKRSGVGQSCLVNDDFVDTVYSGFIIRFRQKVIW